MEEYQFPDIYDVPIPVLRVQEALSCEDPETPSLYRSEAYFAMYQHDEVTHTAELKSLHRHVPSRKTSRRYYMKSMKPEAAPPLRPIADASDDEAKEKKEKFVNITMNYERAAKALQEKMHKCVAAKQFQRCIDIRNEQAKLKRFKDEFDNGDTSNLPEFRSILTRILVDVDMPHMKALPKHFTLITWNVWKGEFECERRWEEILRTVALHQPHAICFQEVSAPFVELMEKHSKPGGLLHYYGDIHRSDDRIEEDVTSGGRDYGVLLLTHKALGEPYRGRINLRSKFNRWLETAAWKIGDTQLTIATVHLESSRRYADARVEQMNTIFESLKKWDFSAENKSVIFCGDFNFAPTFKKEQTRLALERSFVDIWPHLHPDKPGFTEDTDTNLMRYKQSGMRKKQVRFDRMMLHSPGGQLLPHKLQRLGMLALSGETEVFPSDHFGLVGLFNVDWTAGDTTP